MQFSSLIRQAIHSPVPEKTALLLSLAKLLDSQGLRQNNAPDFLALLSTQNQDIADILFSRRDPASCLATIATEPLLIGLATEILVAGSPTRTDGRVIRTCVGYLSQQVKFAMSVSDIQHLAKYLLSPDPDAQNMVMALLERIGQCGTPLSPASRREAVTLLDHYQDNSKNLADILPSNLFD